MLRAAGCGLRSLYASRYVGVPLANCFSAVCCSLPVKARTFLASGISSVKPSGARGLMLVLVIDATRMANREDHLRYDRDVIRVVSKDFKLELLNRPAHQPQLFLVFCFLEGLVASRFRGTTGEGWTVRTTKYQVSRYPSLAPSGDPLPVDKTFRFKSFSKARPTSSHLVVLLGAWSENRNIFSPSQTTFVKPGIRNFSESCIQRFQLPSVRPVRIQQLISQDERLEPGREGRRLRFDARCPADPEGNLVLALGLSFPSAVISSPVGLTRLNRGVRESVALPSDATSLLLAA